MADFHRRAKLSSYFVLKIKYVVNRDFIGHNFDFKSHNLIYNNLELL